MKIELDGMGLNIIPETDFEKQWLKREYETSGKNASIVTKMFPDTELFPDDKALPYKLTIHRVSGFAQP